VRDKFRALLTQPKVLHYEESAISIPKIANAAAAAEEAQLSVEQSKLIFFHAEDKKDQFMGDQWLD
jgi:hypothetical protein